MRELSAATFFLTGDVARLCDVSSQTVRFWETTGLLRAIKTERGVRLFNRSDVLALKREREQRRSTLASAGDTLAGVA